MMLCMERHASKRASPATRSAIATAGSSTTGAAAKKVEATTRSQIHGDESHAIAAPLAATHRLARGGPFVTTFGLMAARRAQAAGCSRFNSMAASPYGLWRRWLTKPRAWPLLKLPSGFSYRSMGWRDEPDERPQPQPQPPRRHGRGALAPDGNPHRATLIRNHELGAAPAADIRLTGAPIYDHAGSGKLPAGGTTTLIVRDGKLVEIRPSLGGTLSNCAGGPTPGRRG